MQQFERGSIYYYTKRYFDGLGDLSGKTIVDIPAGLGHISQYLKERGANVISLDLYPENIQVEGIQKIQADMNKRLPLDDASVDIVVCQEGIEHIPNQLGLMMGLSRILKKGGRLIITTPSLSHMRARLSDLLVESEYWKRMPASEVDSVFSVNKKDRSIYFGHIFLISSNHLRILSRLSGFKIIRRMRTNLSLSSLTLGILFYPLILLVSGLAFIDSYRKNRHNWNPHKTEVFLEQLAVNTCPSTLFYKDLFWVLEKQYAGDELWDYLESIQIYQDNKLETVQR